MSERPANRPANRDAARRGANGKAPKLSRTLVSAALFVFVGFYLLSGLPGEILRWKMAMARDQYNHENVEQAFETAESAQAWDPDNLNIAWTRLAWRQHQGDLEAALDELDALLDAAEGNRAVEIRILKQRASLLQQMRRHEDAIDDASRCVEYEEAFDRGHTDKRYNLNAYNMRGYTVARAAAAGRATAEQIRVSLVQMRDVLQIWDFHRLALGGESDDPLRRLEYQETELMYLDTFAYLRLAAGDKQRALRDFNRCIPMCDQLFATAVGYSQDSGYFRPMANLAAQLQQHKAVMLHHRGEAYFALGNRAAASDDFQAAKALGYDPAAGVW